MFLLPESSPGVGHGSNPHHGHQQRNHKVTAADTLWKSLSENSIRLKPHHHPWELFTAQLDIKKNILLSWEARSIGKRIFLSDI